MCFVSDKHLKLEVHLNNILKFSFHFKENTTRLHDNDHFFNAVKDKIAVYSENYTKHSGPLLKGLSVQ
jgi:hypothetical protein